MTPIAGIERLSYTAWDLVGQGSHKKGIQVIDHIEENLKCLGAYYYSNGAPLQDSLFSIVKSKYDTYKKTITASRDTR